MYGVGGLCWIGRLCVVKWVSGWAWSSCRVGWVCGVELGGKWSGVDVAYCWGWVGWNGIGLVSRDN